MEKKSIDIFQVLLKNYLNPNDFKNYNKESLKNSNLNKILFGKDIIITFIDKELYDEEDEEEEDDINEEEESEKKEKDKKKRKVKVKKIKKRKRKNKVPI